MKRYQLYKKLKSTNAIIHITSFLAENQNEANIKFVEMLKGLFASEETKNYKYFINN